MATEAQCTNVPKLFLGISGLIGAGKTTLATALSAELGLPACYEPVVENAYLDDFYGNMARYSFSLQVYLLNKRFRQHQQIIWNDKGGVQDRTIYEDSIFARVLHESGLMEKRDYLTYCELFGNMSNFMRKPNLIVHLDVTPEESLRRIKERNRACEAGITLEYLTRLRDAYELFLNDISRAIPVIKVDYAKFHSAEDMARMVVAKYKDMRAIHVVDIALEDKQA